jgi:hypothetical protein
MVVVHFDLEVYKKIKKRKKNGVNQKKYSRKIRTESKQQAERGYQKLFVYF